MADSFRCGTVVVGAAIATVAIKRTDRKLSVRNRQRPKFAIDQLLTLHAQKHMQALTHKHTRARTRNEKKKETNFCVYVAGFCLVII